MAGKTKLQKTCLFLSEFQILAQSIMNKNWISFLGGSIVAVLMLITTFYFFENFDRYRNNNNSNLNIWSFIGANPINTNRKLQNIETFARLYGYARWFHPSDEAQEIDWDKFAILGVQKVENVKSTAALRDTLYNLFSPIVQGLQIYEKSKPQIFHPEMLLSSDHDAKPIAWQHFGVYLNDQSNIYKSIRTNKIEDDKKVESTTVTKLILAPSHLTDKEVKLSGYFKSNKEGAKLFIQPVISSSNDKKYEALIEESQDWEKHELLLTIPKETIGIIYGFQIEGDAEVWADDLEFLVKSERYWETADIVNMGFEHGKIDDWSTSATFHKIEVTDENSFSGKYSLKASYSGKMFDDIPQFSEITKATIGNNLICVIPLTLLSNGTSTCPKTDSSALTLLQAELTNISINRSFNPHVNLASVIIAWNVLQHFFPYFDVIDTDWNKVLKETLKSTLANKQKKDFFVSLSRMIAKINDGHGVVYGEQIHHLPIRTEFIEKQIVITASNNTALKRGDIIKKIDGKPVMKVLDEMEKIISGSPHLRRYRALNVLGSKINSDEETYLLIVRDGKKQNVTIKNNSGSKSLFLNPIDERLYLNETIIEIEHGIYYVNMANCTENEFEQKIDVLANAKAVIYDQRDGMQFSFFQIVPYLIEEPVTSAWWRVPQTIYPDRKEVKFSYSNWDILPKQPLFKSKTIILNEPLVVSSGETMMDIIEHYNLAITVGEPTAGCNGNANHINLPCGYNVMWTGMKVLKHDDSQLYLKGFEPDYPVKKTIKAVKERRDEFLAKALEVARQ